MIDPAIWELRLEQRRNEIIDLCKELSDTTDVDEILLNANAFLDIAVQLCAMLGVSREKVAEWIVRAPEMTRGDA